MADVNDLNIVDASNTDRFPEGQAASSLNNGARALEGIVARWHKDTNGSKASTGSANAYVFAADQTLSTYYDGLEIVFDASFANTGAATLNVDGQGADTIKKHNDQDLVTGDIEAGQKVAVIHDGTNWQMQTPTAQGTPVTTRGDIVRGDTDGNEERLAKGATNLLLGADANDVVYSGGTVAKTADYTVVVGDHRKTILVDATSGNVTITLLAVATAADAFEITVQKTDSSTNLVIVDGDGTETIDAPGGNRETVNLVSQFDRLKLTTNATKWLTLDHRITFQSAETAITVNAFNSVSHNLGAKPYHASTVFRCTTTADGFAVGDETTFSTAQVDVEIVRDITVRTDTLIGARMGATLALMNTGGAFFTASTANYRFIFRAWL